MDIFEGKWNGVLLKVLQMRDSVKEMNRLQIENDESSRNLSGESERSNASDWSVFYQRLERDYLVKPIVAFEVDCEA